VKQRAARHVRLRSLERHPKPHRARAWFTPVRRLMARFSYQYGRRRALRGLTVVIQPLDGEIGRFEGVRFVTSPVLPLSQQFPDELTYFAPVRDRWEPPRG